MSKVQRYDRETPGGYDTMFECDDGDYVRYEDYEKLLVSRNKHKANVYAMTYGTGSKIEPTSGHGDG